MLTCEKKITFDEAFSLHYIRQSSICELNQCKLTVCLHISKWLMNHAIVVEIKIFHGEYVKHTVYAVSSENKCFGLYI